MPASFTPASIARSSATARPTDDEILGLAAPPAEKTAAENPASVKRATSPRDARSGREKSAPAVKAGRATRLESVNRSRALRGTDSSTTADPAQAPSNAAEPAPGETETHAGENQFDAEPESYRAVFEAHPDLREAWHDAREFREIFPNIEEARALQKLFPTAAVAERASQELAELDRLDALFFSNRPEAHAELAAAVYRLNPEAFQNLVRVMAGLVGAAPEISGQSAKANAAAPKVEERGQAEATHRPDLHRNQSPRETPASDSASPQVEVSGEGNSAQRAAASPNTEPAARAAFYQDTNAAAVEAVLDAITAQVDRLLPEGTAAGARNRVIGEIYRELDAALRGNRALVQQARQAFRSGALDAEHQRAIVGLIVGRARQALPGVAKKVIGEWTSTVLAAANEKIARQRAGERRVDIAGAGPAASEVRRALTPADINYAKMSDADILNL